MGARRRNADDSGSLDSLLDTLTNVVGILVILLALARLDVTTKARAIQGIDDDATPEALTALRKTASELEIQRADAEQKASDLDPATIEARVEDLQAQAERIKAELARPLQAVEDPESIRKKIAEVEKQIDDKQAALQQAESDVAQRRARLEEIRPAKEPPAKIVHLPNPRAPPAELKPVLFVCKDQRVAFIDPDAATDYAVRILKQRAQTAPNRCDCEKASTLFDREKYGNDEFRLRLKVVEKTPYLLIEHVPGKGTTARQVDRSASAYGKALAQINVNKQYARFLVWPDSYEVYLAARDECDKRGVAAGWQPFSEKAEWQLSLADHFRCSDWVEPPSQPPAAAPNPPPAPRKPTPVDTVD